MRARLLVSIVAAIGALSGAAVWFGGANLLRRSAGLDNPFERLIEAGSRTRRLEARLTGGFRHTPWRESRVRGTSPDDDRPPLDLRLAAAEVEAAFDRSPTPIARARAGVARLLLGDLDVSVALLGQAVADGAGPDSLVDLGAAYLTRGRIRDSAEDHARALDTLLQAVETAPDSAEARFNIGLALQALHLAGPADAAWRQATLAQHEPGWREEARAAAAAMNRLPRREDRVATLAADLLAGGARLDVAAQEEPDLLREAFERSLLMAWADARIQGRLDQAARHLAVARQVASRLTAATHDRQPVESVRTLEAACARTAPACRAAAAAYVGYVRGREAWDHEATAEAYASFDAARPVLTVGSHPEAGWIAVTDASRDFYGGRFDAAQARMAAVVEQAERRGFTALSGRAAWMLGLIHGEGGRFGSSLDHMRRAVAAFERCRDRESLGAIHHLLASYYEILDESGQAWSHEAQTLAALAVTRRYRYEVSLGTAARLASREGLHRAALVFLRLGQDEMRRLDAAASLAMTSSDEARELALLARRDEALAAVAEARRQLARVADRDLAALVGATLDTQEANVVAQSDPARAATALQRSIAYYDGHGSRFALPGLLLTRGRVLWRAGRQAEAEADWLAGLRVAVSQRRTATTDAGRVALHASRWDLYSALADARARWHHDPVGALERLEQGRAINLQERLGLVGTPRLATLTAIRAALPPGTLVLAFATLPAHTLAWTVDRLGVRHSVVARTLEELSSDVRAWREAVEQRRETIARERGGRLYETLLGWARADLARASRLIVVPDGPLHELPFGALWNQAASVHLVEQHAVLVSPSAAFALSRPASTPPEAHSGGTAVVVGDPARGTDVARLGALPGADREASAVSARYQAAVVLQGAAATRTRLISAMRQASVVHFAGHALVNRSRPELSRLVLAPDATDSLGALFVRDMDSLRLPHARLVVLAACETARGAWAEGEGVIGLARGFMGAGAESVVATLWRIDDRASVPLFEAFHAGWVDGLDAAEALRRAQVQVLRNRSFGASIADWAAPVVMGLDRR